MICVFKGPLGTETICNGDSGGPLMVRLKNSYLKPCNWIIFDTAKWRLAQYNWYYGNYRY